MVAVGVIPLILFVYTLIFYSYLANHSDHDVAFFLSVSLILLVMNLGTNAGGTFGLAWLYLIVAALFIGVGFAVDKHASISFYQSIGPWFKSTFTDASTIGYKLLSFIVFPVGIVFYYTMYNSNRERALICGRCGLFGLLLWAVLLWAILGLAL